MEVINHESEEDDDEDEDGDEDDDEDHQEVADDSNKPDKTLFTNNEPKDPKEVKNDYSVDYYKSLLSQNINSLKGQFVPMKLRGNIVKVTCLEGIFTRTSKYRF